MLSRKSIYTVVGQSGHSRTAVKTFGQRLQYYGLLDPSLDLSKIDGGPILCLEELIACQEQQEAQCCVRPCSGSGTVQTKNGLTMGLVGRPGLFEAQLANKGFKLNDFIDQAGKQRWEVIFKRDSSLHILQLRLHGRLTRQWI